MNWPIPIINPRFIPAYAGNSVKYGQGYANDPVHPRLRGELIGRNCNPPIRIGSSPLTRGTLRVNAFVRMNTRFIPAYAGNSLKDGINPSIHTLGI